MISVHLRLKSKGRSNLSLLVICLSFQRLIKPPVKCTIRFVKKSSAGNANAHLYGVGYLLVVELQQLQFFFPRLQGLSLPLSLLLLSNRKDRINYKLSDGDWVTGQPKPLFATFGG